MKTRIFKSMMPVAVMVFAVAAAFATQAKEVNNSAQVKAYHLISSVCEDTEETCNNTFSTEICTIDNEIAYGLVPGSMTNCSVDLYRP